VPTGDLEVDHVLSDIETLNPTRRRPPRGDRHLVPCLPLVADRYAPHAVRGSIGDGYGPLLVAKEAFDPKWISETTVAVPGHAHLGQPRAAAVRAGSQDGRGALRRILDEVREGRADVGLVIHEGQLTYGGQGLVKLLDLGACGRTRPGSRFPSAATPFRRDLGPGMMARLTRLVRETVKHSLATARRPSSTR